MTETATPSRPGRRRGGHVVLWLVALALLALLGWRGWQHWQGMQHEQAAADQADRALWRGLEARIDALRKDQRAQAQRIARADATNRVLRDEILGVGQRAALLEDSVDKLAEPLTRGSGSLRLDEAELLLSMGETRLRLAGDLAAAKRAYALAAGVLETLDDPGMRDLRQALQQERAELDALDADPRREALDRLDAFEQSLSALDAGRETATAADAPWWKRALARIVQVRPSDRAASVVPDEREAGLAALQLEFALARSAAERRDEAAWRQALARADAWLAKLWPHSGALQQRRAALATLRDLPLELELPALGSTLAQLRATREGR